MFLFIYFLHSVVSNLIFSCFNRVGSDCILTAGKPRTSKQTIDRRQIKFLYTDQVRSGYPCTEAERHTLAAVKVFVCRSFTCWSSRYDSARLTGSVCVCLCVYLPGSWSSRATPRRLQAIDTRRAASLRLLCARQCHLYTTHTHTNIDGDQISCEDVQINLLLKSVVVIYS